MWGKLFNILKLVLTFAESFQKLEAKVKEQGEQIRELTISHIRLHHELQLQKERGTYNREKDKLQAELQQLRERLEQGERLSLPPSKSPDEPS
jgi:uncharacterized coiled-coil DUF342 family protein